jgi:hypothetical protein
MSMTYYQAALSVLSTTQRPLTVREITAIAIDCGFIEPEGKTPHATMAASLYLGVRNDKRLVKLQTPGNGRAKRGSVRWMLR